MVPSLERALAEVEKLPEAEQEGVAAWLLEELASERRWVAAWPLDELVSERRWTEAFDRSPDALDQLAGQALREFRAGRTKPPTPEAARLADGESPASRAASPLRVRILKIIEALRTGGFSLLEEKRPSEHNPPPKRR